MKVKADLSVIIPTYNNIKGLEYLLSYFEDKNCQVIVVDNKTSKEKNGFIVSLIHCYKDRLIYLPQNKNLGFAGAVNLGAKNVETKWMLVLNDDVEFPTSPRLRGAGNNSIEKLIQYAEEKKLDAVSPILRNPDGRVENYGYNLLPIGKIQLVKEIPRSKFQETNKSKNPNPKQKILNTKYEILNTNIDGITAACLLIKTEVFKKLGGFDESFFAYLEDVDLFLRMKPARFAICPDIEVLHNHMITTKTMGNFKTRQDMINWWRLYFKHPEKFRFNLDFILERLRNISGYLKATFK